MNRKERHKSEARIGTFVIAMLLLLMFLFVSFDGKLDKEVEEFAAIEIELESRSGSSSRGGSSGSPSKSTPATPKYQEPEQADVTMDNPDAVEVKKKKPNNTTKKTTKPTVTKREPTPEEIKAAEQKKIKERLDKILNKGKKGDNDNKNNKDGPGNGNDNKNTSNNSGGGSSTGPGDGNNPSGLGIDGKVGNRSITHFPKNTEKYNTKCFVKVKVTVDKKGNVTHAAGTRGTRCGNTKLLRLAVKLAYKTKFKSTTSGPPKAEGVMSFNFGLK